MNRIFSELEQKISCKQGALPWDNVPSLHDAQCIPSCWASRKRMPAPFYLLPNLKSKAHQRGQMQTLLNSI